MEIKTPLHEGYLPPEFSKQASANNKFAETPIQSPPIYISNIPPKTQSLALIMRDHDAIPVCGFTWIHWVALITDPTITELAAGLSQLNPSYLIQGKNSNAGSLVGLTNPTVSEHYTGPQPPDVDHEYQFDLIALDNIPNIKSGFWLNELYHQIHGHQITQSTLRFLGKK